MFGEARQLVREGKVTACYPEEHVCRVEFEDKGGLVSDKLPILTTWALDNKMYHMPDVGEKVVCLFASNADQTGTGWIIGSRFHDNSPPNANDQDITRTDFKDGTWIQYNRRTHELRIECVGNVIINAKNIYLNEG